MSARPPRPPGTPWLSPYLTVRDAGAALAFCERAFGFVTKEAMKMPDGKIGHVEMYWRDSLIMFGSENPAKCTKKAPASSGAEVPIYLYAYCEDVDAFYEQAVAAGAKSISAPQTMFYGDRSCTLEDPDGYWWCFATNVADFDPSKMPTQ